MHAPHPSPLLATLRLSTLSAPSPLSQPSNYPNLLSFHQQHPSLTLLIPTMGLQISGDSPVPEPASRTLRSPVELGQDPAVHTPSPVTPALEDIQFDQSEPDV